MNKKKKRWRMEVNMDRRNALAMGSNKEVKETMKTKMEWKKAKKSF